MINQIEPPAAPQNYDDGELYCIVLLDKNADSTKTVGSYIAAI